MIVFVRHCDYDRIYSSLFDQLLRSGTSIGANVVEARAGSSAKRLEELSRNCIEVG